MNRSLVFLILMGMFLSRCNKIDETDVVGEWIINKATFRGGNITMASKSIKFMMLPIGYEHKTTLTFNVDSTVDFPGIFTKDIPLKWTVKDKRLILSFDSLKFKNDALSQLDSLKTESLLTHNSILKTKYNFKRDSILGTINTQGFKTPLAVYSGTYTIEKVKEKMVLTSATTRIELLNLDDILKMNIDGMFKNINKIIY